MFVCIEPALLGFILTINVIITVLYMVFLYLGLKKPWIIGYWLFFAGIQCALEIGFSMYIIIDIIRIPHITQEYPVVTLALLKPLSLLTALILTGFHYRTMKGGQVGEVIPM